MARDQAVDRPGHLFDSGKPEQSPQPSGTRHHRRQHGDGIASGVQLVIRCDDMNSLFQIGPRNRSRVFGHRPIGKRDKLHEIQLVKLAQPIKCRQADGTRIVIYDLPRLHAPDYLIAKPMHGRGTLEFTCAESQRQFIIHPTTETVGILPQFRPNGNEFMKREEMQRLGGTEPTTGLFSQMDFGIGLRE
jgi:hypothetical protein